MQSLGTSHGSSVLQKCSQFRVCSVHVLSVCGFWRRIKLHLGSTSSGTLVETMLVCELLFCEFWRGLSVLLLDAGERPNHVDNMTLKKP